MNKTLVLMLAVCLALPLAACRSKTKGCCPPPTSPCDPCAPISTAPPMAPSPGPVTYYEPPPAPTSPDLGYPADAPSQDEFNAISADLEDARARNADAERVLNAQEAELQRLREQNQALARDLDGAMDPAPEVAVRPNASMSRCSTLAQDLRDMGGLEIIEDRDTVVVRVTDAFRSGSERLKPDARLVAALRDAATAIKLYPGATVSVIGHSDTQPIKKSGWGSNTELSLARAQTVRGVLADNGVQTTRMSVDGRGEMEPLVSPEHSAADQARNRRVEIRIQF
jgi:flagellar motor protein MotB